MNKTAKQASHRQCKSCVQDQRLPAAKESTKIVGGRQTLNRIEGASKAASHPRDHIESYSPLGRAQGTQDPQRTRTHTHGILTSSTQSHPAKQAQKKRKTSLDDQQSTARASSLDQKPSAGLIGRHWDRSPEKGAEVVPSPGSRHGSCMMKYKTADLNAARDFVFVWGGGAREPMRGASLRLAYMGFWWV